MDWAYIPGRGGGDYDPRLLPGAGGADGRGRAPGRAAEAGVGEGGDHAARGHGSVARHRHLPRQWAAALGRADVRGDLIRNERRVRGRARDGDGERGALAGGADDRAVVGRDQDLGCGPPALHDLSLRLPARWGWPGAAHAETLMMGCRAADTLHV